MTTKLMGQVIYIDQVDITNKRVLLRADFDVPVENKTVINTLRLERAIPTIKKLLSGNNRIICLGHLGRPEGRDPKYSLSPVVKKLQELLPEVSVKLVNDFLVEPADTFAKQTAREILVLENIRFYKEEKDPTDAFTQKLASVGDVFVQDAFGNCHRFDTSMIELPKVLPSYGGLSLKEEVNAMETALDNTRHPYVVIIGGIKTETKIPALRKLLDIADTFLLGGGIANTLLAAQGIAVGKSKYDPDYLDEAKEIIHLAAAKQKKLLFATDAVVLQGETVTTLPIGDVPADGAIMDIGPETQQAFAQEISSAQMITWNGPVGDTDEERFSAGSQVVYGTIIANSQAYSLVGGGDTTTLVEKQPDHGKISYISTGGGAMLEYIEKGALPGIEILKK